MGVMGLLDEECQMPKGSEEQYVSKMHKFFAQSPYYAKPERGAGKVKRRSVMPSAQPTPSSKDIDKLQFSVIHYAGKVTYTAEAWLEKNRGFLQPELAFMMSNSAHPLLPTLFKPKAAGAGEKKKETVLASFRNSLRSLSATLLQTSARYIRCVKPNMAKVAGRFDGHFISRQLRYTGVAAVVEIQRSGYPISLRKGEFVKRYRSCAFSNPALLDPALDENAKCTNLLNIIRQVLQTTPPLARARLPCTRCTRCTRCTSPLSAAV